MDWDWGWAPNVRRVDVRKSFVVREILRRLFMVFGLSCVVGCWLVMCVYDYLSCLFLLDVFVVQRYGAAVR
jgi:hypothetical protein